MSAIDRAGVRSSDQDIHWPLITKVGTNDFGKTVHFYYNYSSSPATVSYAYNDGKELTNDKKVIKNEKLALPPWGIQIVEED